MLDIYQPYKKLDDDTLYINNNSNHPSTVIIQIPKAMPKYTSGISSSKEICDQNISYYKDHLKHYGFDNVSLPYNPTLEQGQDKIEKQKRKRKIISFNPTFQP